jgi:shikimate 5-dehydrogenase
VIDDAAAAVGAVNCVYRRDDGLAGTNTDIDGVAEALNGLPLRGAKVAIIGGGGGARAALQYLRQYDAEVLLVVRRPEKVHALHSAAVGFEEAADALRSAALIVNATPLGLSGGEPMPHGLLEAVRDARAAAAFDMVYQPLETAFLGAAKEGGARPIDGLTMLIGQARRAFSFFFETQAPAGTDDELRRRLTLGG